MSLSPAPRVAADVPTSAPPRAQRLFVVGSGIMGAGIAAQALLSGGYEVELYDIQKEFVEKGAATVRTHLDRAVKKGKMRNEERLAALARLTATTSLDAAARADLVVEAAPEKLELKKEVFRQLDRVTRPDTVLGTNTSSLSITAVAAAVKDPGRVVGIHFFNPVPAMALVELIGGYLTRPETMERARSFALSLGKTITTSKDSPGFVTSRSTVVLCNEAIWMLYEGVASKEDIDTAHKLGFNHPMGPLELADLVGLDTALSVLERLYTGFQDPKYRACPLLVNMVTAGKLGRKTGEGFYRYDAPRGEGASKGG
jgi:3-hydroxybutyryl-CoA dehydrogenase